MVAVRNTIYLYRADLPAVLKNAMTSLGLSIRELPEGRESLSDGIACFTWFYEALRHPVSVWLVSRRLRRAGVPLATWNRDAPHYLNRSGWRLNALNYARVFDIYATHTLIDTRRTFADMVLYLANAADISQYHLSGRTLANLRDPSAYDYDVSFFGAMNGERYKEMRARQEFFTALGERLRAKGIRFLFRETAGMDVAEQVALIQKSRINLNFGASCEYGISIASGLPERCYGIPACGGFLLCDRRTHARDDFTPGENWAEFDGLDDCVEKIEYWLTHFDAARDLAERCHEHVMEHHTYAHRAEQLHRALLAWHAGQRGLIH